MAIENKLNQVLGIKREVVDVEANKTTPSEKPIAQKKSKPAPGEEKNEEKYPAQKKEPQKSAPRPSKKEPAEARNSKEDVSLDDIANLFK